MDIKAPGCTGNILNQAECTSICMLQDVAMRTQPPSGLQEGPGVLMNGLMLLIRHMIYMILNTGEETLEWSMIKNAVTNMMDSALASNG